MDAASRKIELVTDGNIPYLKTSAPAMAVATKFALTAVEVSVAQSDANLAAQRAKFHNIPIKVDNITAAPSPETSITPSVSVAQSDASTTAAEIHQPGEAEEIPEIDRRGMTESQLMAEAVSIERLMIHVPKNPYCKACCKTRFRRKPRKRRTVPRELNGKFG